MVMMMVMVVSATVDVNSFVTLFDELSVYVLPTGFGGDLFGNNGSVASPYYPRHYPNSVRYTWTVTVQQGLLVMASFETMDLEGPWRGNCAYDYLQVSLFRSMFHVFAARLLLLLLLLLKM